MGIQLTRQVIDELVELLQANSLKPVVTTNEVKPLASVTEDVVVDVTLETVVFTTDQNSSGRSGYIRNFLFSLYVAAQCPNDKLTLMDVIDSLESSILKDSQIWEYIIDRDIVSVTYDHAEITPVRGATLVLEVRVRMDDCT